MQPKREKIAIPLAYFITFTCYGTWLHGEKATSVDRFNNTPGTNFLSINYMRSKWIKEQMTESNYILDEKRRGIVMQTIIDVCKHRRWVLLAAHVRSNHVHLVIHAISSPEIIINNIKAYASRSLNAAKLDNNRIRRWTHHGSTRYLWNETEVESTILYVVYGQGSPMSLFENHDRKFYELI